jgi:CubicO group peptidase (beta-lactamase class C family)
MIAPPLSPAFRHAVPVLVTLVAFGLATPLSAQDADPIDEFVRAEMNRQQVPGVAVAIVRRGEVERARGYGFANVEHRVPVGPATIFQSGSVGKQFTAAVVMWLVEDGRIGLDEPVTKYLPEAPAGWGDITVRHLLTHTSGIPDYTPQDVDRRRDYTEDELARMAFGLTREFPPGTRWNYSNTGYVLLGVIVRRASGRFYGDILAERVFAPLGMSTARVISEADIVPDRAAGYRLVDGALRNQEWVSPVLNTTADGSLYVSVLDLVAWDRGLRAKAVLRPESWAQVFEPVRLASGNPYPYGFGWSIDTVAGQTRVHHGGSWQGFQAYIARYLGDELTIVVLANLAQADTSRFVDGIAALLNPALTRPAPAPITDEAPDTRARLEHLLDAAAKGTLSPADFAYVRAGFFPGAARRIQDLLSPLGRPARLDLLERITLGDDQVSTYEVTFADRVLIVRLGLAPDGRVSAFQVRQPPAPE